VKPICLVLFVLIVHQATVDRQAFSLGSQSNKSVSRSAYQNLKTVSISYLEDGSRPQRIRVDDGQSLYVDLNPIPYSDLITHPDRLTPALELMVRIENIRLDLNREFPLKDFWKASVDQIEKIPLALVDLAVDSGVSEEIWQAKSEKLEQESQAQFEKLNEALKTFANGSKLQVVSPRGPLAGYSVRINVGPPKVAVQYMTFGNYQYCRLFGHSLDNYWVPLHNSAVLIGKYRYRAVWPQGPIESNFLVTSKQTVLCFTKDGLISC
jgi:hypothetical protein